MGSAGLRLIVDTPTLTAPVYVDPKLWEKIVLNRLQNALKFTFAGEVAIRLSWHNDHVELAVADTGTGVPPSELPHLFERFYCVRDAKARSHPLVGAGRR